MLFFNWISINNCYISNVHMMLLKTLTWLIEITNRIAENHFSLAFSLLWSFLIFSLIYILPFDFRLYYNKHKKRIFLKKNNSLLFWLKDNYSCEDYESYPNLSVEIMIRIEFLSFRNFISEFILQLSWIKVSVVRLN